MKKHIVFIYALVLALLIQPHVDAGAGVGKIHSIIIQVLDSLGITTHGVYSAPSGGSTYTGTANQVIVTGTTLSLPQSIHTAATPTFSSLTLTSLSGGSGTFTSLTSPGSGALSERHGATASATGDNSAVFGYGATDNGTNSNTVSGYQAQGASAGSGGCAYGYHSSATGNVTCAYGYASQATATYAAAFGYSAINSFSASAFGAGSTTTANNQFVSGSDSLPISDVYFGRGVFSATPGQTSLRATSATASSGADGGDIGLFPGAKDGSGKHGKLKVSTRICGTAVLDTGGTVTVAITNVTASTIVILTPQDGTLNVGSVWVSARVAGTSFTIKSSNTLDARTVAFLLVEPE